MRWRAVRVVVSHWFRGSCVAGVALASVSLACGGTGQAERTEGAPRRVFLVTVDTLRADHTSAYGYPRETSPTLERLAAEGSRFEQAVCQWPKTGASFASMFTGRYPQTTGLTHEAALRIPEGNVTLPELYQSLGYTTVAVVSNGVLNTDLGWDRGFDEYLETWHVEGGMSADPQVYRKTINAPRVNELALPLLERHRDAERLFVWLHYSDPHAPYVLPDRVENPFLEDRWYTQEETVKFENRQAQALGDRRDLKFYVAQYDANVLVADLAIGRALERARELGLLADALVIYTADHGESLGEHDYWFEHGRLPYSPATRVPLVLWGPGRVTPGVTVERPVELVDLYPTLLELAAPGEQVPGLEGKSLVPFFRAEEESAAEEAFEYAYLEAGGGSPTTHYRAVQDPRWKLVYHPPQGAREAVFELYDLAADPLETRDVKEHHRAEARRLRELLWGWMKGSDWIRRDRSFIEEHSAETLKALKALGYVD
jgi:arylsulfatase A-like enzyme